MQRTARRALVGALMALVPASVVACSLRDLDRLLADGPLSDGGAPGESATGDGPSTADASVPCDEGELCAKDIAVGSNHSCAVLRDGRTVCWGANESNQLAYPDIPGSPVPIRSLARSAATAVFAADSRTCILVENGGVRCWGNKGFGALGADDGELFDPAPSRPVLEAAPTSTPLTGVTALVLGRYHAFALRGSAVLAWGLHDNGSMPLPPPRELIGTARLLTLPWPVASAAAGHTHGCFLNVSNEPWCFGASLLGQLAAPPPDGADVAYSPVPATELAGRRLTRICASSAAYSCGVDTAGTLVCWGTSTEGATGIQDTPPFDVAKDILDVSCRRETTCALTTARTVVCLGDGTHGLLGRGDVTKPALNDAMKPLPVVDLSNVAKVVVGEEHACALTLSGAVRCWGKGTTGALGDGASVDRGRPVRVAALPE